jgi:hypothetical protein
MPGRKIEDRRALIAIFLPAIFLLSIVCRAGEPGIEGYDQSNRTAR